MIQRSFHRYWGKAKPSGQGAHFHLLPYHCLDVAATMRVLLDNVWAERLGLADTSALRRALPLFSALHDLGKFARGFQNLAPDLSTELVPFAARYRYGEGVRHDTLGHLAWRDVRSHLEPFLIQPRSEVWAALIRCMVGHHGQPPKEALNGLPLLVRHYFDPDDIQAAIDFASEAAQLLSARGAAPDAVLRAELAATSWRLAGLGVLADWIGSNQTYFEYLAEPMPLDRYWEEHALPRAKAAIAATGMANPLVQAFIGPRHLFDYLLQPTPLQTMASELPIADGPHLFILEDVTGAGKTEAALTLVHRLMAGGFGASLYFALPTMATANQMFRRVGPVHDRLFEPGSRPNVVLSHGSRHLVDDFRVLPDSPTDRAYAKAEDSASGVCSHWLGDSNKKALLADVGVGTVDQALLSVMPAQHQSLRLLGLQGKVLVVDEVHAYDAYTGELLCALLKAHANQGGSVVLLSATLPNALRTSLVNAYRQGQGLDSAELPEDESRYPLLTWQSGNALADAREVESRPEVSRSVPVNFLHDEGQVLDLVRRTAQSGASVAWVRNTVDDARESWEALRATPGLDAERITLFHSRYALADRLSIETRVLDMLGKASTHAQRKGQVVVSSPVLSLGLDFDADVMIIDLAPIDEMVQRAGRLHRHVRDARGNPASTEGREPPVLHIHAPAWTDDPAKDWYSSVFRRAAMIYPDVGRLWLSQRILKQTRAVTMPQQARLLIESVYGVDADAQVPKALQASRDAEEGSAYAERTLARGNCLSLDRGYRWEAGTWDSELRTPTRLAEETNGIVLLVKEAGALCAWAADHPHPWEASTVKVPARMFAAATSQWAAADAAALESLRSLFRSLKYATLLVMAQDAATGGWYAEGVDAKQLGVRALYDPVAGWRTGSQGPPN